jgi:cysteinyl-tRNA synthetase
VVGLGHWILRGKNGYNRSMSDPKDIYLYNTLSRSKELFKAITPNKVGIYNCGPTVYDQAHIGNLRSYVFADILRRTFKYNNYDVHQVINITDVGHLSSDGDDGDDKMSKALIRLGMEMNLESMRKVGTVYFDKFVADLTELHIELPENFPRASDHIAEDIELIKELDKKGISYTTSDGVYFDTSKFPSYGKLGNIKVENQKEGSRVAVNTEKKNSIDFALWKFNSNLGWDSPWGKGFPGWHLECSAMSRKYLGQPFDIHTGGIDHISIHHNNEIAQSEAAYDVPLSNYWMHNEFVLLENNKMAKSAGDFITLNTLLEESISPLAYRYWLLTAHYRSPVNFGFETVLAAQTALIRLMITVRDYPEGGAINTVYQNNFNILINDDLDTPRALALVWELVKDGKITDADKRATLIDFDRVLGLNLASLSPVAEEPIPIEVQALADAREEARKDKDWVKADALREEIELRGFEIIDTEKGIKIREKGNELHFP